MSANVPGQSLGSNAIHWVLNTHLVQCDDVCFYYHSWRNNVVIAFGTLSSYDQVGYSPPKKGKEPRKTYIRWGVICKFSKSLQILYVILKKIEWFWKITVAGWVFRLYACQWQIVSLFCERALPKQGSFPKETDNLLLNIPSIEGMCVFVGLYVRVPVCAIASNVEGDTGQAKT